MKTQVQTQAMEVLFCRDLFIRTLMKSVIIQKRKTYCLEG